MCVAQNLVLRIPALMNGPRPHSRSARTAMPCTHYAGFQMHRCPPWSFYKSYTV